MNSKHEFASNELIRLESKKYSWEEKKINRLVREEEKKTSSDIENFIQVMKLVQKCNNKRKFNTLTNSRSSNESGLSVGPNKKLKMTTSTPAHYRSQPLINLDESPVTAQENMDMTGSNTSAESVPAGEVSDPLQKGISTALDGLKMTPPKTESDIKVRARLSVTANDHSDSQEFYRRRLNTVPTAGSKSYIHSGKLNGRCNSMEEIDFSNWNSGDSLGMQVGSDVISDDLWENEESYGLASLFIEQEERELIDECVFIEDMTRKKLYDIFNKMCPNAVVKARYCKVIRTGISGVLATPEKRNASPLPELDNANPAKTARLNKNVAANVRSHSIGSSPLLRKTKKCERKRTKSVSSGSKGQQKVTNWCRIIKK